MTKPRSKPLNLIKETLAAEQRIRGYIKETPLEYSPYLSDIGNCQVYLKLENLQETGSFKYRGATNFILSLTPEEKERGVVTASTGNHGAACAHILKQTGVSGTIYLPENTSGAKLEALRSCGVQLKFHGTDCIETEIYARKIAEDNGRVYIPPYNHPRIIAGQATIAVELARQLGTIDTVFVPVGGGGLISGIAGYLKSSDYCLDIIGCQPENSPVMYESIRQSKIVEMDSLPTLADGTAGGIEKDSLTFELCQRYVDDFVLVSEKEIGDALLFMLEQHRIVIEGAAALSIAAFIQRKDRLAKKNVVLVITGNKISLAELKALLCNNSE